MRKRNTGFRKFSAIVFSAILVLAMSITAFAETGSHDAGNTQDSAPADVTETMAGDEDGAITVTDEPGAGSDVTPADPEVPAGTAVQQGTGDASAPAESEAGGEAVTPTEDTTGTETVAPVEGTETPATEPSDVTPADVTEVPALPGENQTETPAASASAGNTLKSPDAAASDVSIVPADEDELQDEDPDAVSPDEEGDTENTDPDMSDEAAALQARIDALPSVEELAGMGDEELEALYAEVSEILALAEGLALDTAKLDAIAAFFSPEAMLTGTLTGSGTEADPYIAVDEATLNEAVEAVPADAQTEATITLNADIVCKKGEIVVIPAGKKIRLDMAGHSVTVEPDFEGRPFINEGSLIVTGNGTIDSSASESGGYGAINNKGTLTIESGTFKGHWKADGSAIRNTGDQAVLTIHNGKFEGATCAICNEGTVTINNGTYIGTTCSSCDGAHWSYTIRNTTAASHMVINGGEFIGTQGALSASAGYLEVNGGSFKTVPCAQNHSSVFYALYVAGEQENVTCIVNSGTFETEGSQTAVLVGNDKDGGKKLPATVTFNGGVYKTANTEKSAIEIGGTTGYPIVHGGSFSKIDENILEDGFTVVQGSDGLYQIKAEIVAKAGETTYATLADAIANANGETIVLQANVVESIVIPADANITLDLNGHTLTNTEKQDTITNYGILTITGDGMADNVSHQKAVVRNQAGGAVTISGGKFTRSQENGKKGDSGLNSFYVIVNNGTMNIEGGEITNTSIFSSMIINNAEMTISGGVICQDDMTAVKNEYCATSLVIKDSAVIRSANSQMLQNWSKATISGGTLTGNRVTSYTTEYTSEKLSGIIAESHLEITGGTIDCAVIQGNNYYQAGSGKWTSGDNLSIHIGGNAVITTTDGIVIAYNGEGGEQPAEPAGSALITAGVAIYGPTESFEQYLAQGLEIKNNKVTEKEEPSEPDPTPTPETTPPPEPGSRSQQMKVKKKTQTKKKTKTKINIT